MVSETKQSKRKLEHWMGVSVLLAVYDVVAANISYLFALLLRFDFVYSIFRSAISKLSAFCADLFGSGSWCVHCLSAV